VTFAATFLLSQQHSPKPLRASAGDALYGEDERECSARGNLAESVARCVERRRGRFKSIWTFVAHELKIQSDDEGVKYFQ
jgi:hypothetical protein